MKQYLLTILVESYEGEEGCDDGPLDIDEFRDGDGVASHPLEKQYPCSVVDLTPIDLDERPVGSYVGLMDRFMRFCPEGQMGVDNDGQLVFYTGKQETPNGAVEPHEAE